MEQETIMPDNTFDFKNLDDPQSYIENNPDLICISLADWTITYANESFLRFFGITKKDLAGKKLIDFIYPEDQHKFLEYQKANKSKSRYLAARNR